MKLIRYSKFGFIPQFQKMMHKNVEYLINFTEDSLTKEGILLEFTRNLIKNQVYKDRKSIDYDFNYYGVHVFFDNTKEEDIKFLLNHLPRSSNPPRHEIIVDDMTAYALGASYLQPKQSLKELRDTGHFGAYLPL